MTTVSIKLPAAVARLYPKVGEKIFLQALRESVQRYIADEKTAMKSVKARIRKFERKYKMPFKLFEKRLPIAGDYRMHEDYGEWSFLEDKAKAIAQDLETYQSLQGTLA